MLSHLTIHNLVLIEKLDLSFEAGLSVLTGETGAGKSILLDALGLAIGARSESGLVRKGADKSIVIAQFDIAPNHIIFPMLEDQDLVIEPGEPLVLRRSLSADGRSRAFINDQPVSIGLLKQIGGELVDIHGQFSTQGLLDVRTHIDALDGFAKLEPQRRATAEAWHQWRDTLRRLEDLQENLSRVRAEEEYLRHAVADLDALDPKSGEEEDLADKRSFLMVADQLRETLAGAYQELEADDGAQSKIGRVQGKLETIAAKAGERLNPIIEALDRVQSDLSEAISHIQDLAEGQTDDGDNLQEVEDRLFALRDQARKHDVAVDELADLRTRLADRLSLIEDDSDALEKLSSLACQTRQSYIDAAIDLSKKRQEAASKLDKAVMAELPPLKLERARFSTHITQLDEGGWGPNGQDRVCFMLAANPGADPAPLHKAASGGELSRIMLAIKVILAETQHATTLIFDEADSGIGGAVADAVGERLARLSQSLQTLVITHSPQVAARGLSHMRVHKTLHDAHASTQVTSLSNDERREEIARMLAGKTITDEARKAADQLLGY